MADAMDVEMAVATSPMTPVTPSVLLPALPSTSNGSADQAYSAATTTAGDVSMTAPPAAELEGKRVKVEETETEAVKV